MRFEACGNITKGWSSAIIKNSTGKTLSCKVVAKSCSCVSLDDSTLEVIHPQDSAFIGMTAEEGSRSSRLLESVYSVVDVDGLGCILRCRREFRYIPALEVSPVSVTLRYLGDSQRCEGHTKVIFFTNSKEFANDASLSLEGAHHAVDCHAYRRIIEMNDGVFKVHWDLDVVDSSAQKRMSTHAFVLAAVGKESWSLPIVLNWEDKL